MKVRLVRTKWITIFAVLALSVQAKLFAFDLDDANSPAFDIPIEVQVGDTIRFVVDENLSTGYSWIYNSPLERGISNDQTIYVIENTRSVDHNMIKDNESGIY